MATVKNAQKHQAIVTDGLWRKSLSTVRSLGKAGFEVHVMGGSSLTTSFWSKHASTRTVSPLASQDPAGFGSALTGLISKISLACPGARPVLFPMEDPSLRWVAANRSQLEKISHFLLPTDYALQSAFDKGITMKVAREAGLPCPRTWEPSSAEEFIRIAQSQPEDRFVIKPRSGTGSSGIKYGERATAEELRAHWKKHGSCIIQERIPRQGTGVGVSLLFDRESRCRAIFTHKRLREYPHSGGPSTDRMSVHMPELEVMSIELMKRISWRGIAMVEWKIDPRDGRPRLMEINPRFWGSLELAVRAGVDFPALYARAAMGEDLPPPPPYKEGVRCRWMIPGDILRYLTSPWKDREGICKFLGGLPGSAEEWDAHDLKGTLGAIFCTGALALNPRYWKYVRRRGGT
ncbi:MAG: hypothetical protein A2583_03450 [Bdellovibrionales bacterium RIFOXYD1_FULL_53_11]|nr:MAG: hypothetical protein A2583_03450 [Bdellovibrionales bacterium RIFOXYD1_FULL_53_11]